MFSIVLLVLVAWCLLSVVAALVLSAWPHRAGEASAGPARQQTRVPMHGSARLAVLPYLMKSTARTQKRRRQK